MQLATGIGELDKLNREFGAVRIKDIFNDSRKQSTRDLRCLVACLAGGGGEAWKEAILAGNATLDELIELLASCA
jgi:hypothetical protein